MTIDGNSHMRFSKDQSYQGICTQKFVKSFTKTTLMYHLKEYLTTKYGLWIDELHR